MADGRHFEKRFISIFKLRIIRFRSNLVHRCKFPFRAWKFDKKSKFFKFKMADGRHIENRFLVISRRLIGRLTRNSEWKWRITCTWPKMEMFPNSWWRTNTVFGVYLQWVNVIQCFSIGVIVSMKSWKQQILYRTRSSADADNGLDAFSSQSRSTNMAPFWVHCEFSLSMWSAPCTKKTYQ